MIKVIDIKDLISARENLDLEIPISIELLKGDLKMNLLNYLVLTMFPEKFSYEPALTIYYNRYYWFVKYFDEFMKIHKHDLLNLRQQELKIIEEGEKYSDIDWAMFEVISNMVKLGKDNQ